MNHSGITQIHSNGEENSLSGEERLIKIFLSPPPLCQKPMIRKGKAKITHPSHSHTSKFYKNSTFCCLSEAYESALVNSLQGQQHLPGFSYSTIPFLALRQERPYDPVSPEFSIAPNPLFNPVALRSAGSPENSPLGEHWV